MTEVAFSSSFKRAFKRRIKGNAVLEARFWETRHTRRSTLHRLNRVNITTIQLLRENLERIPPNSFDDLIVDEFHHAAAKSYRDLIAWAQARFLLGLTATPFRGDRQNIAALCDQNVLVEFELRSGIDLGVLSPYHYFGCFDDIDYSKIQHSGERYDIRDLERALIIPERDEAVIQKWREYADEKPTLAFCCSHRHAKRVSEAFNEEELQQITMSRALELPIAKHWSEDFNLAILKSYASWML